LAVGVEQAQHREGVGGHDQGVADRGSAAGGGGRDASGILKLVDVHVDHDDRQFQSVPTIRVRPRFSLALGAPVLRRAVGTH